MRKSKLLLIPAFIFALVFSSGCSASQFTNETAQSSANNEVLISSFRDYNWGTLYSSIKANEITDSMRKFVDYREDEENGFTSLTITSGNVAGYDISIEYGFSEDKLVLGGYDIDIDDTNYKDLTEKYSSEYGTPFIQKESIGWGPCSVWSDSQHNIIIISGILGICYIEHDSKALDFISNQIQEFHEIDLYSELNKIDNTSGI